MTCYGSFSFWCLSPVAAIATTLLPLPSLLLLLLKYEQEPVPDILLNTLDT